MSVAVHLPLPPELEQVEIDRRSVLAFGHGFPSELVRWHHHDEYELHLIVASVGKIFVGDHIGAFSPGQFVLTGPRLPHNWISQTAPGETFELRDLVVQFRQDLVQSMAIAAPELESLLPLLERASYGIEFQGAVREEAEARFRAMIATEGAGRVALLIEFLERLSEESSYRLLSTMPMRSEADDVALDKVERVTRYVTENHAREIPLAVVAELVGMSESAFSRFFAKATGNGFTRFLNRIRIARACELLTSTEGPITDICFEVGFNNVANFNRRFREHKAVTPREYRKQARLRHGPLPIGRSDGTADERSTARDRGAVSAERPDDRVRRGHRSPPRSERK